MPRRPLSSDQKRALAILIITFVVIVIFALGVAWLAMSLGVPAWIAVGIAAAVSAGVGLFMFLEMS